MALTNAQAALQAAATVYSGSRGNVSVETVAGMASMFKRTLDKADRDDQQRWRAPDTVTPVPGVVRPHPMAHRLSEDHNGDPVCACSWNPALQTPGPDSREQARNWIRYHIVEKQTTSS